MTAMGEKSQAPGPAIDVVGLSELDQEEVRRLLHRHGMTLCTLDVGRPIPGSFWGEPEAGLVARVLHARPDTPAHSVLHEACHFICMDARRRETLDTDAGGDYDEEEAVCYLQILLADQLTGFGRSRCVQDMDTWGYHFRLGSAGAWFEHDADEARAWLRSRGLIDQHGKPLGRIREHHGRP